MRNVPKKSNNTIIYFTVAGVLEMSRYYLTRLHVPVRRHYDTFDNFFMNRFRESMDAEVARRLWDWERQLESIKRDFFQFSPRGDANLRIDANKAVKPVSLISLLQISQVPLKH